MIGDRSGRLTIVDLRLSIETEKNGPRSGPYITSLASRPCLRALREDRALPPGLWGPVDCWEFWRLARRCLLETTFFMAYFLRPYNLTGDRWRPRDRAITRRNYELRVTNYNWREARGTWEFQI